MSRKRTTDVIWAEGRPRQPPKADEDLARRLAQNPKALLDGPPLAWLKRKLEMVPPDWIGSELPETTPQKVIEHNEVDVGQETDLDFMDADINTVRRPVIFTVTNNPGVRDIVQGRVESRFVNPGDIEIDPALAPYIELTAGRAGFTVSGQQLGAMFDVLVPAGRWANLQAGFGLQVAASYSTIIYADNVRVQAQKDDDITGASPSGAGTATWDLPGLAAYTGGWTTGWKTCITPTALGTPTDYVFVQGGGEPYLDALPSQFTGTMFWRWVYMPDGDVDSAYVTQVGMPTPADPTLPTIVQWNPDTGGWEEVSDLDVVSRVGARVNSGGTTYERRRINLIEGAGLDLTIADDSVNEEVDVTVTFDGSEVSITSLAFPGGDTFLRADGTFTDHKDRLVAVFSGTPVVGGAYPVVIPRGNDDADITIDLERLALRVEVPASAGDTTAVLQKSTGGGVPAWSDVATITVAASSYEGTEQTIGAYSITSGDLLRLYFTAVGTGVDWYTGTVTGSEV